VSVNHYENFPVASVLCPRDLRPAVAAIYHFARTADDIADEGEATPAQRLSALAAYRDDLRAVGADSAASSRWPQVFEPLRQVMRGRALPAPLLEDLLSAFEQDVTKVTYVDRPELLDYCRRSANPVGRLLLHLYGVQHARALAQSDAICTALQLANFWQDLGVDTRRGRLYLPQSDRERCHVDAPSLLSQRDSPQVRQLVGDVVRWTRELMLSGAPLVHAVPGRAGWELRLVVQGGLRILDKIEALGFDTLRQRPRLNAMDVPIMLWRALWMRTTMPAVMKEAA